MARPTGTAMPPTVGSMSFADVVDNVVPAEIARYAPTGHRLVTQGTVFFPHCLMAHAEDCAHVPPARPALVDGLDDEGGEVFLGLPPMFDRLLQSSEVIAFDHASSIPDASSVPDAHSDGYQWTEQDLDAAAEWVVNPEQSDGQACTGQEHPS